MLDEVEPLHPENAWIWSGYDELRRHRKVDVGFGVVVPQPIEYSEVTNWLDEHRIRNPDVRKLFRECVAVMDAKERAFEMERASEKSKK